MAARTGWEEVGFMPPVYFLDVSPVRNSTTSPSSTFTPARNAHDTSSEPEQSFAASNLKAKTL